MHVHVAMWSLVIGLNTMVPSFDLPMYDLTLIWEGCGSLKVSSKPKQASFSVVPCRNGFAPHGSLGQYSFRTRTSPGSPVRPSMYISHHWLSSTSLKIEGTNCFGFHHSLVWIGSYHSLLFSSYVVIVGGTHIISFSCATAESFLSD